MTTLAELQQTFTTRLPWMRSIARTKFRHLHADRKDEALQNMLALCWKFHQSLFRQGRADPGILRLVLWYAIRQTKSKRTVQGKARCKDALDCWDPGQASFETYDLNGLVGRATPIPEQVSFRVDVSAFFRTLNERQRNMACALAAGETTGEVARNNHVTSGDVSRFRRRFKTVFEEFLGE
jgi:hypothetical protein